MAEKESVCAYRYCLHHGEKVKDSESVVLNNKKYHWDCAALKQEIKECADIYIEYVNDKSQYPIAIKTISNMVLKNKIPVNFIIERIKLSRDYYSNKPAHVLYGIRKIYWEKGR